MISSSIPGLVATDPLVADPEFEKGVSSYSDPVPVQRGFNLLTKKSLTYTLNEVFMPHAHTLPS